MGSLGGFAVRFTSIGSVTRSETIVSGCYGANLIACRSGLGILHQRGLGVKTRHELETVMPTRNVPLRSGRLRGHNLASKHRSPLTEIQTRRPSGRKGQKLLARAEAARPVKRIPAKRRRGEPAPVGDFGGKAAAHWSTYRQNRLNVKRKPEARRKPAAKKAMRRGARNLMVLKFAPKRAINRARRNKAGMAPGATRRSKSAVRD